MSLTVNKLSPGTDLGNWLQRMLFSSSRTILSAMFLSALSAALGIYIIAQIATVIATLDTGSSIAWKWALVLLALLVLQNLLARSILSRLAHDLTYRIREDLVDRVLGASLRRIEVLTPPRIYTALSVDVNHLAAALGSAPLAIFNAFVVLVGVVYIASISLSAAAIVLITAAAGVAVSLVVQRRASGYVREERRLQDRLLAAYEGAVFGKKELSLSNRRRRTLTGEVERELSRARSTGFKADMYWEGIGVFGEVHLILMLLVLVALMPVAFLVTSAQLAQIALVVFYCRGPVSVLVFVGEALARAQVALANLRELDFDDHFRGDRRQPALDAPSRIEYRNVAYRYADEGDPSAFALAPTSLTLRSGEVAFITGGNGSGKSTLCKVLTGLYEADSGEIRFDGDRIVGAAILRQHSTALFYDYHLFDTLALPDEDSNGETERVARLLETFALTSKVSLSGNRWSTTRLSAGQRRRLAMISTLIEERRLILFDEPMADQDAAMRHRFYDDMLPALRRQNRIVVVVTHDESYFHCADVVYKLQEGRLMGDGTKTLHERRVS